MLAFGWVETALQKAAVFSLRPTYPFSKYHTKNKLFALNRTDSLAQRPNISNDIVQILVC
jgi:hypothetical protein